MKRSMPVVPRIGMENGIGGQPWFSLPTLVLLVVIAGPRTKAEGIVPFGPGMEPFDRYAEDSGSVCGENGKILRDEEARMGVDIASRKRPRGKKK